MPPVKKPPKNAFSFYMDEHIPRLVQQGIKINHKEEAVKHLLQEWKDLSKDQKHPYEEMAREWKVEHHGRNARPDHEKLDCFGIPVVNHLSYDDNMKQNQTIISRRITDYAKAFIDGELEILFVSYQSQYEDPDELGFCPVEVAIMAYTRYDGIKDLIHFIMDPGPPPYGMKAECRQHAVQTHHIDPFSNQRDLLEKEMIYAEQLSKVWTDIVDFVHKSQIKTDEDRQYLKRETGEILIQSFCSKREMRCCDYCNDWVKRNCLEDIAHTETNEDYYQTVLEPPMMLNDLVKEIYRLYNSQTNSEPIPIPTDDELHRDVDRPLHCENQVRCTFHDEIDCDFCAQMECYRVAYALSYHLQKMGLDLDGNHFPENEVSYEEMASRSSFIYQKTEQQKRFETRQRGRQMEDMDRRLNQPVSSTTTSLTVPASSGPPRDFRIAASPTFSGNNNRVESWVDEQLQSVVDPTNHSIHDYESSINYAPPPSPPAPRGIRVSSAVSSSDSNNSKSAPSGVSSSGPTRRGYGRGNKLKPIKRYASPVSRGRARRLVEK